MNKSEIWLNVAESISALSKCKRLKVGAIILSAKGTVIACGYNGTPFGDDNDCECNDVTKDTVIHAEINAIITANEKLEGSTLYVTHAPCLKCAAMIRQTGISKVVWRYDYRNEEGINYLKSHNLCI